MMSYICWLDIISVVPEIPASGDDAAINSNVISTLLANCMSLFFINGKPTFINGPRSLPRNSPDFIILDS